MRHVYGCSDATLSAINEAAALEVWKGEKQAEGELSISELYKGGMRIIRRLTSIHPSWPASFAGAVADSFLYATMIFVYVVMSGKVMKI
jgi:hypothetical protein